MKNDEKRTLTPRLRFPEFREAWKTGTIGDLFDHRVEPERATTFESDKILTVKLHANGVVRNERTGTLTGATNYFKRRAGQFIFSKIDLLNGAFGIVPDEFDGFCSSSDVPAFSFRNGGSPLFFLNWLQANYQRLEIERTGTSNTLKRISPTKFRALPIRLPSPAEQQKIADCLTSLDELIAAQERKVDALKANKKGLMQQLFPREGETLPRLRFPEFRDAPEWRVDPLGELFETMTGGTPDRAVKEYWDGVIPWITTSLVDFSIINHAEEFISEEGLENSSAKLFPKNTVLIALYGQGKTRGKVALLGIEAATNQACAAILPGEGIKPAFTFLSLCGRYDEMRGLSNSGGQENLSQGLVRELPFRYPENVAEQQRIADCLSTLDARIAAEADKLSALKMHKQGLMQQLFPSPEGD